MNKDYNRVLVERHVRIEIPENAYDIRIGNDLMTQGVLFKTPTENAGWRGHFCSFGSIGQSPVAMIAKRFVRNGTQLDIYA